MAVIFEGRWPRSLDLWCQRIVSDYLPSDQIDLWLFDDEASRRAAQVRLAAQGFQVRIHAALKPLVHFFRDLAAQQAQARLTYAHITHARISYPVSPHADHERFRLEAYPLAALLPALSFTPQPASDANALHYRVTLAHENADEESHRVFCPNRLVADATGQPVLTPCGWLRVRRGSEVLSDQAILTDIEQLYHDTMAAIRALPLAATPPFFEELRIEASLPFAETPLGYGDEVLSLQEALHEEFYFSALEAFQHKAGLPPGDRSIQPGQIAPFIRIEAGADCRVRVRTQPLCRDETARPAQPLGDAQAPLSHAQIHAQLADLGGAPLTATSRCGRPVAARYLAGHDQAVMISACQHGNETTGTVGALLAAHELQAQPGAHFVVSPLENPDGNALLLRLLQDNPRHMHHAARYTAYGNDMQTTPDDAPAERAIRLLGQQASRAALHLNLHGYPSHEWIRPLSGYIPRGFALWTLPKGFFLIFRYQTGFETLARQLAQAITERLSQMPGLLALNRQQIELYRQHAGPLGFEIIHNVPCSFGPGPGSGFAIEMVSEFPDESISGAAFAFGTQVQKTTVLAAYHAWQTLYPAHQARSLRHATGAMIC